MRIRPCLTYLIVTAVLLLPPAPVGAQVPSPALSFAEDTAVTWVMATAVVTGGRRSGKPLSAHQFHLEVDGEDVEIESFDVGAEAPLSLLYFQDLSGSMANGGKLEASRRALGCHLEAMRRGDTMAVTTFAASGVLANAPLSSAPTWRAEGTTALHDAVARIPEVSLPPGATHAAVLVTDGIDNASALDAAAARTLVRRAEVPVYVLALRGSRLQAPRPKKSRTAVHTASTVPRTQSEPDDPAGFLPYARVLRRLAESTGGRYYEIQYADDVDLACAAILHELRNRYILGFPLSTQGEETYRGLRITIPGRNVHLRHRAGYLGSAPR